MCGECTNTKLFYTENTGWVRWECGTAGILHSTKEHATSHKNFLQNNSCLIYLRSYIQNISAEVSESHSVSMVTVQLEKGFVLYEVCAEAEETVECPA
jgi:hypothetical protein